MNHALLDDALDAAARLLRGTSGLARLMLGVTSAAVLLAVAAWLFRLGALDAPGWVLAVWIGLVVAVLTGLAWGDTPSARLVRGTWRAARKWTARGGVDRSRPCSTGRHAVPATTCTTPQFAVPPMMLPLALVPRSPRMSTSRCIVLAVHWW